ncbi:NADPH-dependent FMN reductase [Kytococcus sedentarius]|nr:NADPH-dependent FMN reductase [Kytococcus sedentarius]
MAPTAQTPGAGRFSDLSALFINCTLKPGDQTSHTQGLMDVAMQHMRDQGVSVDLVRAVDHDIAPGVQPDMREEGLASDDWPALTERVLAADILVLGTPIWLGDKSSVATRVVERLYSLSGCLNDE